MKSLISIILLIVTAISITGCTVVRERHYGRAHHEVIVTHEHRPARPIPPRRPGPPKRRPGRPAPSRRGNWHD